MGWKKLLILPPVKPTSYNLLILNASKRQYVLIKKPPKRLKILQNHLIGGEFKIKRNRRPPVVFDTSIQPSGAQAKSQSRENKQAAYTAKGNLELSSCMASPSLLTIPGIQSSARYQEAPVDLRRRK